MEKYTPKEWLHLMEECQQNSQEVKKEFICVYCNCKKKSKMRLNDNRKKGCEKAMDDHGNQLTFKLYLPFRNTAENSILAKGGNVLEYKMKLEASSKPKCCRPVVMKIIPPMQ